jgi:hypothetical protein
MCDTRWDSDCHVTESGGSGMSGVTMALSEPGEDWIACYVFDKDNGWTDHYFYPVTIYDPSADTDCDGSQDWLEAGAPNGGDGNGDGVPDSQQANVSSFPNSAAPSPLWLDRGLAGCYSVFRSLSACRRTGRREA